MFVRFKDTKKTGVGGKPIYNGVIIHDGKKHTFTSYVPSLSAWNKNTHEAVRKAMRAEVIEYFNTSPYLFEEIK